MLHALLVFVGGGLGSLSRYLVGLGLARWVSPQGVPAAVQSTTVEGADALPPVHPGATLLVNVVGCFLIGLVWGRLGVGMREETRLLLIVGFLGGFTTFSAVGWETFALLGRGQHAHAALTITGTIGLGLAGVWAGHTLGVRITPG